MADVQAPHAVGPASSIRRAASRPAGRSPPAACFSAGPGKAKALQFPAGLSYSPTLASPASAPRAPAGHTNHGGRAGSSRGRPGVIHPARRFAARREVAACGLLLRWAWKSESPAVSCRALILSDAGFASIGPSRPPQATPTMADVQAPHAVGPASSIRRAALRRTGRSPPAACFSAGPGKAKALQFPAGLSYSPTLASPASAPRAPAGHTNHGGRAGSSRGRPGVIHPARRFAARREVAACGLLLRWAWKSESPAVSCRALILPGDDLLSHTVASAVPSALRSLTAVFGMGTGVSPSV